MKAESVQSSSTITVSARNIYIIPVMKSVQGLKTASPFFSGFTQIRNLGSSEQALLYIYALTISQTMVVHFKNQQKQTKQQLQYIGFTKQQLSSSRSRGVVVVVVAAAAVARQQRPLSSGSNSSSSTQQRLNSSSSSCSSSRAAFRFLFLLVLM